MIKKTGSPDLFNLIKNNNYAQPKLIIHRKPHVKINVITQTFYHLHSHQITEKN